MREFVTLFTMVTGVIIVIAFAFALLLKLAIQIGLAYAARPNGAALAAAFNANRLFAFGRNAFIPESLVILGLAVIFDAGLVYQQTQGAINTEKAETAASAMANLNTAQSAAALGDGAKVALVIGNSRYAREPSLASAQADALSMAKALQNVGFKVDLLLDAGHGQFDKALDDFSRQSATADTALFYYSGHGLTAKDGAAYLLPTDFDFERGSRALSVAEAEMALTHAKTKIMVLDTAGADPNFSRWISEYTAGGGPTQKVALQDGMLIAAASRGANSPAGAALSPFTKAVVQGLRQPDLDINKIFENARATTLRETLGAQDATVVSNIGNGELLNTGRRSDCSAPQGDTNFSAHCAASR